MLLNNKKLLVVMIQHFRIRTLVKISKVTGESRVINEKLSIID